MKKIGILSVLLLLVQASAMASHAERGSIGRGMTGCGEGYDCSRLTASTRMKLTAQQTAQIRALNEKYPREIQPIRKQLRDKGKELKAEWLQTEPDRGKIEVMRGEAAKLQGQIRAKSAAYRADILKILTPEQRSYVPDAGFRPQ